MPAHSYSLWFKPNTSTGQNQSIFYGVSQFDTFIGTSYIDLRWLGNSPLQDKDLDYSILFQEVVIDYPYSHLWDQFPLVVGIILL